MKKLLSRIIGYGASAVTIPIISNEISKHNESAGIAILATFYCILAFVIAADIATHNPKRD